MMEGPWCRFRREARAREQHRHAAVDSLKVLDPKWPIREARTREQHRHAAVDSLKELDPKWPIREEKRPNRYDSVDNSNTLVEAPAA
jgi:hypothetical protein